MEEEQKTYQYGLTKENLQEIFKRLIPVINEIRSIPKGRKMEKEKKAA